MKVLLFALLFSVLAVSGCTQTTPPDVDMRDDLEKDLSDQEVPDPCENVTCDDTITTCPDGTEVSCQNICSDGTCSSCEPDCSNNLCEEDWSCSEWEECSNGEQARVCVDSNSCGTEEDKPLETQSCTVPGIAISLIEPVEEVVEITNSMAVSVDMTNWTLHDNTTASSHIFTFPAFTLEPGSMVRIHKGVRENSQANLYWGNNLNIWNNDGDKATLTDSEGNIMSSYEY